MICLHSSHKNKKNWLNLNHNLLPNHFPNHGGIFFVTDELKQPEEDLPLNSSGASERTSQPPLVVDTVLSLPELVNKAVYTM